MANPTVEIKIALTESGGIDYDINISVEWLDIQRPATRKLVDAVIGSLASSGKVVRANGSQEDIARLESLGYDIAAKNVWTE